ncbi:MAG TPA: YcaO-like family protein [Tabrizicola sp.]|nr:YcaO-like family protein [Tabrizicola sp.]
MKHRQTETLALLDRSLARDFQLVPLHAPEAPLFLAVALPLDDAVTGLKPRLPAGRGLTPQQAMLAAGAEAMELRASLAQRHAEELALLPRRDGVAYCEARDLVSDAAVPVAAQEVYLDCAAVLDEPLRWEANSTGCAVGRDREMAVSVALWECIERDALALWWHGNRPAAALDLEMIDPHQPRLFWWLHQRTRRTTLMDVTTDIGLPVVVAVSSDRSGRVVAMGAAARPERGEAALAAVTEMVQSEVSLELAHQAGDPEACAWIEAASTEVQSQFRPEAPKARDTIQGGLHALLERLTGLGHRALAIDLTLPDDPLPSVRVLVPGLCAMQGRIGTPRFRLLCPAATGPNLPEPF